MNPLPPDAVDSSNANLPKPSPTAFNLSEIPIFTSVKTSQENESYSEPSSWSPSTDDGPPKYEYEFSNLHDGRLYFVHLFDTNDLSACERVLHRPIEASDITYSPTGNGFVQDDDFKYTFTKQPYQRTVILPNIKAGVAYEKHRTSRTAEDILASL